jgi:hypothetical protein
MFTPIFLIEEGIKLMGKTSTILKYVLIAVLMTGCFLFGRMSGCNQQPALESIRLVKDTSDQKIIDTLKLDKEKLQDSCAVMNYQLDENANKQDDTRVKYQVKETFIKAENSDKLYAEFRLWLSGNRPLTGKRYEVDSADILNGMLKKNDNAWLREENDLLNERCNILDKKTKFQERTISDDNLMLGLKDDQITKLEGGQVQVVKRKWYVDAAIIIVSFTAGYGIRALTKK